MTLDYFDDDEAVARCSECGRKTWDPGMAQGRREKKRLDRLKREAWMALACDELAAKNTERRAKQGPFVMFSQELQGAYMDITFTIPAADENV